MIFDPGDAQNSTTRAVAAMMIVDIKASHRANATALGAILRWVTPAAPITRAEVLAIVADRALSSLGANDTQDFIIAWKSSRFAWDVERAFTGKRKYTIFWRCMAWINDPRRRKSPEHSNDLTLFGTGECTCAGDRDRGNRLERNGGIGGIVNERVENAFARRTLHWRAIKCF